PPPRWRVVTRPWALRPAWRSLRSVRLRSGFLPLVSSSNEADWRKRRTGDVALYCFSGTYTPSTKYFSMRWPSPMVTTAFFQSGRCPMRRPSRRDLPGTWITFTASTSTLNASATASAMSRFVAPFATANVYRPLLVWLIERSVITGRMRIVFPLMLILSPPAPRSRRSHVPPARRAPDEGRGPFPRGERRRGG